VRSLPNIDLVHGAFTDGSDPGETIDVRYSAFTSLQRAGPTAKCVAILRQLSADGILGRSARSLLSLWRLE